MGVNGVNGLSSPEEIEQAVAETGEYILSLLEKFGPMMLGEISELLKVMYGVYASTWVLAETSRRYLSDNRIVSIVNDRLSLPQDINRQPAFPIVADYIVGYFKLLLRWQAVRDNPDLLDLTDDMIDKLYTPGRA